VKAKMIFLMLSLMFVVRAHAQPPVPLSKLSCATERVEMVPGTDPDLIMRGVPYKPVFSYNGYAFQTDVTYAPTGIDISGGTYHLTLVEQWGDNAFFYASANGTLWMSDVTAVGQRIVRFYTGTPRATTGYVFDRVPIDWVFRCL
jgi:hypothetical protein